MRFGGDSICADMWRLERGGLSLMSAAARLASRRRQRAVARVPGQRRSADPGAAVIFQSHLPVEVVQSASANYADACESAAHKKLLARRAPVQVGEPPGPRGAPKSVLRESDSIVRGLALRR